MHYKYSSTRNLFRVLTTADKLPDHVNRFKSKSTSPSTKRPIKIEDEVTFTQANTARQNDEAMSSRIWVDKRQNKCRSRESNTGLVHGKHEFYH